MSEDKSWDEKNFTEQMWSFDEQTLIQRFIVGSQNRSSGDAHTALTVLQAKAALAAKESAKESKRVADATKWLAIATFVMAVATVAMAVATFIN